MGPLAGLCAALLLAAGRPAAAGGRRPDITGVQLSAQPTLSVAGYATRMQSALGSFELYDAAEGGRRLWASPSVRLTVYNGRVLFRSYLQVREFPEKVASIPAVFVEFHVGAQTVRPRYAAAASKVPWTWGADRRPYFNVRLDFGAAASPATGPGGGNGSGAAAWREAADLTTAPGAKRAPSDGGEPFGDEATVPLLSGPPDVGGRAPGPPAEAAAGGAQKRVSAADASDLEAPPGGAGRRRPSGRREVSLADLRLSNNLYFEALRAYRAGDIRLAVAKLELANDLNPANKDIAAALERMRGELQGAAPAAGGALPSNQAMREGLDLYFAALRSYSKGDLRKAEGQLRAAAIINPSDEGVANALHQLGRELAGVPDVH